MCNPHDLKSLQRLTLVANVACPTFSVAATSQVPVRLSPVPVLLLSTQKVINTSTLKRQYEITQRTDHVQWWSMFNHKSAHCAAQTPHSIQQEKAGVCCSAAVTAEPQRHQPAPGRRPEGYKGRWSGATDRPAAEGCQGVHILQRTVLKQVQHLRPLLQPPWFHVSTPQQPMQQVTGHTPSCLLCAQ